MNKFLRITAAVILSATSANADQVEINADMQWYAEADTVACVTTYTPRTGVQEVYAGGQLIAVVTVIDAKLGYVDTYADGMSLGPQQFIPSDAESVAKKDEHLGIMTAVICAQS